jgi:hypothetical protein
MGAGKIVNMRFLLLALLFLTGSFDTPAAVTNVTSAAEAFDLGNKLYEQGKFAEATTIYEQITTAGRPTTAVWFNLGNAAYKAGHIGRAIAAYRMAERSQPRDSFLRANLQFVRGKVYADEKSHIPLWKGFVRLATLNEWIIFASAWLWMFFAVLACGEFTGRRYVKTAAVMFLGFAVVAIAFAAALWDARTPEAVVVVKEATARFGPLDESQAAFQLRDGAEVIALSFKDQWVELRDAEKRAGWIRRDALTVLPIAGQSAAR